MNEPRTPPPAAALDCFCGKPINREWISVMWCDSCLDEYTERRRKDPELDMLVFINEKKRGSTDAEEGTDGTA